MKTRYFSGTFSGRSDRDGAASKPLNARRSHS